MELAEYQKRYQGKDEVAPGWDAIDNKLHAVYGDQEPQHWGTIIKHMLGGPDPLDGISAYHSTAGGKEHLHFCTYGFSSLYYDEESVGSEFSKFGFELTMRLASQEAADPMWVCGLLQKLGRYVFQTNKWFENEQWIDLQGPINADAASKITGFALSLDPELKTIETPHGHVDFLQIFGITESELSQLKAKTINCRQLLDRHLQTNPLLITELSRS